MYSRQVLVEKKSLVDVYIYNIVSVRDSVYLGAKRKEGEELEEEDEEEEQLHEWEEDQRHSVKNSIAVVVAAAFV